MDLVHIIEQADEVVKALIDLTLDFGTLVAAVMLVVNSLKK